MTVVGDPNRSLAPSGEERQPFFWDKPAVEARLARLQERLQGVRERQLPAPTLESLRQWFRTQHVYHSNAIEGSTLTLAETQVVIGDGLTVGGKPLRDVLAAKSLADALDWVESIARQEAPVNQQLIREIHALIMRGDDAALPGAYKREDNRVAGANYRPPSFLQTAELMDALERYLGTGGEQEPVIVSAVTHAWLVGIHPFRDGNGRTARLLSNLVLMRGRHPIALLTEDRRPEYYESLDRAHCTGDLTAFLLLWCSCIERVIGEYEQLSGDLQAREREVAYLADFVRSAPASREAIFERWRAALATLAGELIEVAARLNERLASDGISVSVAATPLSPQLLVQAKTGSVPVIRLNGVLRHGPFLSEIQLSRFDAPDAVGGLWLHLPWTRAAGRDELEGAHLEPAGWSTAWRGADGKPRARQPVTSTALATVLWRQALERTAGLGDDLALQPGE